jgi:hypothetical protein
MTEHADRRDKLVSSITRDTDAWFFGGKLNNVADILCTALTVVGSLAASVLGGSHRVDPEIVAAVAAFPAAVATLQRAVNFRGRSFWYFRAGARMRALLFELESAEVPNVEEFARRRGDLEQELDDGWAEALGNGPALVVAGRKRGRDHQRGRIQG